MDEREWLSHPKTGGYFHCPTAAVDDWLDMGWKRSDPPPDEPSPVVAEALAWRAAQAAAAAQQASKPAKSGTAGSNKKE